MKVSNAMTRDVVCVTPDRSLADAYDLMTEWTIRHLPVIEGDSLVGILSDRDVLLASERGVHGVDVPDIQVAEVMTRDPITCRRSTPIGEVSIIMLENKIDCLPVVDAEGSLVGLVTSSDLISLLQRREDETETYHEIPFVYRIIAQDDGAPIEAFA